MAESAVMRVTIMIERDLAANLRTLQANIMKKTKKNVSFSKVVNTVASVGSRKITVDKMIEELDLK